MKKKFRLRFDIRFVKSNILFLARLQGGERLVCSSFGQIKSGLFGFPRWVSHSISLTFNAFCHEIQNPVQQEALSSYRERKLRLAEKALDGVKRWSKLSRSKEQELQQLIDQYRRVSLTQLNLLRSIGQATQRGVALTGAQEGFGLTRPGQGCSGSYFIQNPKEWNDPLFRVFKGKAQKVGIFKPFDEEIGSPNNPKGMFFRGSLGERCSYGFRAGENVHREVAAYLVCQALGFELVPRTDYATLSHRKFYTVQQGGLSDEAKIKRGSFQDYLVGGSLVDQPLSDVFRRIPAKWWHELLVLDCLIGNTDRHAHNVLLLGERFAAIDNGRSFGDMHAEFKFCYKNLFPQMREPFSEELKKRVRDFPSRALQRLKKQCYLDSKCVQRACERLSLLQASLAKSLLPEQVIALMRPPFLQRMQQAHNLSQMANRLVDEFLAQGVEKLKLAKHLSFIAQRLKMRRQPAKAGPLERLSTGLAEALSEVRGPIWAVGSSMAYTLFARAGGATALFLSHTLSKETLFNCFIKKALLTYSTPQEFLKECLCHWKPEKGHFLLHEVLREQHLKPDYKALYEMLMIGFVQKKSDALCALDSQSLLHFGSAAPFLSLLASYGRLRNLALQDQLTLYQADPLDPDTLQVFFQKAMQVPLVYLSNYAETLMDRYLHLQGPNPLALEQFVTHVQRDVQGAFAALPSSTLYVHTTSQNSHYLRYQKTTPTWQPQDFSS